MKRITILIIFLLLLTPVAIAQYCLPIYSPLGQEWQSTQTNPNSTSPQNKTCPPGYVQTGVNYDGNNDDHINWIYCKQLIDT